MPRPTINSQFIASPVASPPASAVRVPAIVGTAKTTFTVQELITKGVDGGADTLGHTATDIIKVGLLSSTSDFAETTSWILGTGGNAGKIDWSPAGVEPTAGQKYYVTYSYAKAAADYAPKFFDDFNAILNQYGPIELDGNNELTDASYITAAAKLAMDIGQNRLVIVQATAATATAFKDAYDKLEEPVEGFLNPFYLVPLLGVLSSGDYTQSISDALAHVIKMHDPLYRRRRILYTGLASDATVSDVITKAQAVQNSYCVLVANVNPQRMIPTPTASVQVTLDGTFAAVAAAAFRSTQQVTEPALNKIIPGSFIGFATRFSSSQIDNLVDAGAFVLEEESGIIRVVDDITTNTTNEIEIDVTTVEHRDVMITSLEKRLKAKFQGRRGGNSILSELEKDVDQFLGEELGAGNVQAATATKASQVPGSLRRFAVSFSYLPAGKVRDITIYFSIDLALA